MHVPLKPDKTSSLIVHSDTLELTTPHALINVFLDQWQENGARYLTSISEFIKDVSQQFHSYPSLVLSESVQNRLRNYAAILSRLGLENPDSQIVYSAANKLLAEAKKRDLTIIREVGFKELTEGLNESQLALIGSQLTIIQMSVGCSVACPTCNPWALTEPRRHISFGAIEEMCDRWAPHFKTNGTFLHWSSDVGNWTDRNGRDIRDVLKLLRAKTGYAPEITTAVPKGSEETFTEIWKEDGAKVRTSLSSINLNRLLEGEDGRFTVRQFIEKFGQPKNKESQLLSPNIAGGPNLNQPEFQIANSKLIYPTGKNYDFKRFYPSVACKNGVLISPDGCFNLQSTAVTPLTPLGYVKTSITNESPIYKEFYSVHSKMNNLKPIRTVKNDGYHLNQEAEINDIQCFQALYEIVADSILTGILSDLLVQKSELTDSSPEKLRNLFFQQQINFKIGILFSVYLTDLCETHPNYPEANGADEKWLHDYGLTLFAIRDTKNFFTMRMVMQRVLAKKETELEDKFCKLVQRLSIYVSENPEHHKVVTDMLSHLIIDSLAKNDPLPEGFRLDLNNVIRQSSEFILKSKLFQSTELRLRLYASLLLINPEHPLIIDSRNGNKLPDTKQLEEALLYGYF